MKKLFMMMVCCGMAIMAQAEPKTVNVAEAGTLAELLGNDEALQVTDLTVTGELNGTDIKLIRSMATEGRGKLVNLDLQDARIVAGGEFYYEWGWTYKTQYFTADDVVGESMFLDCKLESVVLPESVKAIEGSAFAGCGNLKKVVLPEISYIGRMAFNECFSLESISIPASLKKVGNMAFFGCGGLQNVELPDGIEEIGDSCFALCAALKELHLPASLKAVNSMAFMYCTSLESIYLPSEVAVVKSEAFMGCTNLKTLHIPATLASIETSAFSDCGLVNIVALPAKAPDAAGAFMGVNQAACTLTVPVGSGDSYRQSDAWKGFNIVESEALGLQNLRPATSAEDADTYDLLGRKITNPVKGNIYIRGGKKVVY